VQKKSLENEQMFKIFCLCVIYSLLHPVSQQSLDVLDYDIYGERFAMNEYFGVLADNDLEQFQIFYSPYSSNTCIQSLNYLYSDEYIYSVAVGSQYYFVYIGEYENITSQTFFAFQTITNCSVSQNHNVTINLNDKYQRNSIIGIDPDGILVFVVSSTLIFWYNTNSGLMNEFTIIFAVPWQYSPRSIVVDEQQIAHTIGYFCQQELRCYFEFLQISTDSTISSLKYTKQILGNNDIHTGRLFESTNPITDMSLSINIYLKLLIIGVPYEDTIYIYNYSANGTYSYVSSLTYNQGGIGFGKSVAWLDNETIAILAYSLSTFPWSTSQIQVNIFFFNIPTIYLICLKVYHLNDILNSNVSYPYPFSTYPNSQQNYDINKKFVIKTLVMMKSWSSNNLAILTDQGDVYLIPHNSPGYSSTLLTNIQYPLRLNIYLQETCIVGTYKNDSKFGPCSICPPNTKNNGSFSLQCMTCSSNSFCSLGAVNDIHTDDLIDFNQSYPPQESPKLTDFEDILVHRVFSFGSTSKCLLMSPLFWASIVFGITVLVIVLMGILRLCPKRNLIRQKMKAIFSRLDLIGEGELWIGGLFSIVIGVLIIFSYVYSAHFLKLYPIEKLDSNTISLSCDSSITNSKFSSTLELLSITKLTDQKQIFDMLDSQELNLTIELVNTGFTCSNLKIEQHIGRSTPNVDLTSFNCSKKSNNATLAISTILSNHEIQIQYNLTGSYFISGLRICLNGKHSTDNNYNLQSLDICQFFFTENQSLSTTPYVDIQITKTINQTISLYADNLNEYAGRWLPTISVNPLSNSLLYQQKGDFIRYLNYQTIIIVDIHQSDFYVQNIQEPIIEPNALIFQSILFTSMLIFEENKTISFFICSTLY